MDTSFFSFTGLKQVHNQGATDSVVPYNSKTSEQAEHFISNTHNNHNHTGDTE